MGDLRTDRRSGEQELEVGTGNLAEHRTRLHSAVRSALSHFVRAAHSLQEAAADAATAPGAGGADNGANGAAEANGADTEMVEEGAGEDEKQEAGGEAAPVGAMTPLLACKCRNRQYNVQLC